MTRALAGGERACLRARLTAGSGGPAGEVPARGRPGISWPDSRSSLESAEIEDIQEHAKAGLIRRGCGRRAAGGRPAY
jgi:hypothetical protein